MLDWAISHAAEFKPAKIYRRTEGESVDPRTRIALKLRNLGPHADVLSDRLMAVFPQISAAVGYRGSDDLSIEFELNAYGEGAHFAPHIDIPIGSVTDGGLGQDRIISAVYYFHNEPKAFSGGALRIYRFGVESDRARQSDVIELEPVQNSLVVFPSWTVHAVDTVHCTSDRFSDFRFALNCWFCRRLPG